VRADYSSEDLSILGLYNSAEEGENLANAESDGEREER
jgi:hypothetical protein